MTHKFLRDDGWFQPVYPYDITTTGTATTTGFLTYLTNSTTVDKDIAAAGFTTGPTVAQGSSGIWFAVGTSDVICAAGNSNFVTLLSDGTNTYSAVEAATINSASMLTMTVSGVVSAPAGNLRLLVFTGGSSGILKGSTGVASSHITAIRIG